MPQEMTDEELMDRVVQSDRMAFEQLVDRHLSRAHAIARRVMLNRADAQDMVQESFTKVWTHAYTWNRSKAKFTTWLYRIITNRCIDEIRKGGARTSELPENLQDNTPDAEAQLQEKQASEQMQAVLRQISAKQRIALTLTYFEGYTNKETAEIMQLHVKAVEALLVRGRKALKEILVQQRIDNPDD